MLVGLVGILDDGSKRSLALPLNLHAPITIPRGSDAQVVLRAFLPSSAKYAFADTDTLVLTVKEKSNDVQTAISLVITSSAGDNRFDRPQGSNVAVFTFTNAMTKRLGQSRYVYDVWLVQASGARNQLVPVSPLYVDPGLVVS